MRPVLGPDDVLARVDHRGGAGQPRETHQRLFARRGLESPNQVLEVARHLPVDLQHPDAEPGLLFERPVRRRDHVHHLG